MSAADEYASSSNPFSTRYTRPGQIDYVLPAGQSLESLVMRLATFGWRGQIIGPHGSGKSTLLAHLKPLLDAAGRRPWSICLRDRMRSMPRTWLQEANSARANLVIVDGYEQLSRWQRLLVRWHCRSRGWGLLVSAHANVSLPTVFTTEPNLDTVLAIVARLMAGQSALLPESVIAAHFEAAGGNLRETLFRLYDVWQRDACPRGNANSVDH